MNKPNRDELLDKLIAQARRAPGRQLEAGELSKGLENRILADWKRGPGVESPGLISIFKWGFGCALTASLLIIATTTSISANGDDFYETPAAVNTYSGPLIP